jgi:hypothetical protein
MEGERGQGHGLMGIMWMQACALVRTRLRTGCVLQWKIGSRAPPSSTVNCGQAWRRDWEMLIHLPCPEVLAPPALRTHDFPLLDLEGRLRLVGQGCVGVFGGCGEPVTWRTSSPSSTSFFPFFGGIAAL